MTEPIDIAARRKLLDEYRHHFGEDPDWERTKVNLHGHVYESGLIRTRRSGNSVCLVESELADIIVAAVNDYGPLLKEVERLRVVLHGWVDLHTLTYEEYIGKYGPTTFATAYDDTLARAKDVIGIGVQP